MAINYEIHLDGVHAMDLSLGVLRDLVDLLLDGSSRAARLAVEGRSTARGTAPWWLSESSELRMIALREGSLTIDVAARPLAEVAPAIFSSNAETAATVAAGETAVDLLMSAIAAATKRDMLWTGTPRGELGQQLTLPVDALSSYFGQWPGDEDDEQVFAALKELG